MREERQQEAVDAYLNTPDRRSVINACPRFGKIKVALEIMWKLLPGKILILAPRNDIYKGWTDDFNKFGFVALVDFVTFTSIKKLGNLNTYGMVIIDEPHELSVNQQVKLAEKLL
jgi:superfamily II DNA or RNA helicase